MKTFVQNCKKYSFWPSYICRIKSISFFTNFVIKSHFLGGLKPVNKVWKVDIFSTIFIKQRAQNSSNQCEIITKAWYYLLFTFRAASVPLRRFSSFSVRSFSWRRSSHSRTFSSDNFLRWKPRAQKNKIRLMIRTRRIKPFFCLNCWFFIHCRVTLFIVSFWNKFPVNCFFLDAKRPLQITLSDRSLSAYHSSSFFSPIMSRNQLVNFALWKTQLFLHFYTCVLNDAAWNAR